VGDGVRRALLVALVLGACSSKSSPPPPPAPAPRAPVDPRKLVTDNCLSCHVVDMLAQQRLTAAQWGKVVKKMSTWGSLIEPENTAALVAYLAATYGPDAGPYTSPTISAAAAAAQLAPLPDGALAGGDAARGKDVFAMRCAACHGADAHGGIGVNLVDRPILYRAPELAQIVRDGKGRMPPFEGTERDIADVIAYLRPLR
jgi:mono/diheme cytochrome c family protein